MLGCRDPIALLLPRGGAPYHGQLLHLIASAGVGSNGAAAAKHFVGGVGGNDQVKFSFC